MDLLDDQILDDVINYFGEERIANRCSDLERFLTDFITVNNHTLLDDIDLVAKNITYQSLFVFLKFTKPFIDEDKFANIYKVTSNLIYTVILSDIFIYYTEKEPIEKRKDLVELALYIAYMLLYEDKETAVNRNLFNIELGTNALPVDKNFAELQKHYFYYLTHYNITDNSDITTNSIQLPVVLNSMFLHSYSMWLTFSEDVNNFQSYRL